MVEVLQMKETSMETIQKSSHHNKHIIYTYLEQESRGAYVLSHTSKKEIFVEKHFSHCIYSGAA